jgi:D-alanyl-D-alanine carboxypeptidase/D-alanyl-D-alanine-endopeptidase (penicillin-binding protein 4)
MAPRTTPALTAALATCAGLLSAALSAGPAHAAATRQAMPVAPVTRTSSTEDAGLEQRIAARMSHATASGYSVVADIQGLGRVVSMSPGKAMRPASTQKLFTALPLLLQRPDDRLVTQVAVARLPVHGVVDAPLVVRASDDPSLLRRNLTTLARQVRAAGVRRVTGPLRLNIGSLPRNTTQPGWKSDFVPTDIGPLSPFPVKEDTWRSSSSYVHHPTPANLQLFRSILAKAGVRVQGGNEIVRSDQATHVLASHASAPIHALVHDMLLVSDNFYAESLLAVEGGHATVQRTAQQAGVTDTSSATDGSGLSYSDRETARGEVQLLEYAASSTAARLLASSLPVACHSGTLKHRFCNTAGAGAVFAKTGTLAHTTALAGYTTDAEGRAVTFAVVCTGVRNLVKAEEATDRAVLLLHSYDG